MNKEELSWDKHEVLQLVLPFTKDDMDPCT